LILGRSDDVAPSPAYRIPPGREIAGLRSAETGPLERLRSGINAYDRGDDAAAVALLEETEAGSAYDELRRLYLAAARVALDRGADALPLLDSLEISTLPMPWRREARWFKAEALMQSGRSAEALVILQELASGDDEIAALATEYLSSQREP
jgi:hypothetical protein